MIRISLHRYVNQSPVTLAIVIKRICFGRRRTEQILLSNFSNFFNGIGRTEPFANVSIGRKRFFISAAAIP
jgi:hypothetical protein